MPKTINLPSEDEIWYPVGENLDHNLSIIKEMAEILSSFPDIKFNLWCTGSSGAIISGILSMLLPNKKICICHIKKDGENSHGEKHPFFWEDALNIVVDDFIESGKTIENILASMSLLYCNPDVLCISGDIGRKHSHIINNFHTVIAGVFLWKE